jgi:molybdate-binding protein
MGVIESLHGFEKIKALADTRRLEILRLLMASACTLTQLARQLHHSPAWIRHHLKVLESVGLVEMAETRTRGKVTEKYYRARADALFLQEMILPKSGGPILVFSGSHDLAVEGIAEHIGPQSTLLTLPVGSLDGLLNLRQGICHIAGAHLLDETGAYNTPHIRHLFPEHQVELVTLAHRTQGIMVRAGNPKAIRRIDDLAREDVEFVNRNPGSGTRVWFDMALKQAHLPPEAVRGYDHQVKTHTEAAALVRRGRMDAAIGLQAAAHLHELDFIPLFEERYDLVLARAKEKILFPILDYIQTADFRRGLDVLTGYNTTHSGELISY